jgi:hypothetical protein
LAIVTSSHLLNTYMAWKEKKISTAEAKKLIAAKDDSDIKY